MLFLFAATATLAQRLFQKWGGGGFLKLLNCLLCENSDFEQLCKKGRTPTMKPWKLGWGRQVGEEGGIGEEEAEPQWLRH